MRLLLWSALVIVALAIVITAVSYLVAGDSACMEARELERATHACWVEAHER